MKVLLVNPWQEARVSGRGRVYNRVWPPLDLANAAALVRSRGHEAAILDAHALRLDPAECGRRAAGFDLVFVTSTALDRWQCPHLDLTPFVETVRAVRARAPRVFVTGSHGTVRPAEILALTGAEAVVRGERVVHNPDAPPVRLDDLPPPAFDLLPMERYSYEVMGDRFALFEMSRGCASECAFCLLKTYGDGVRRKSVPRLVAEIEEAVARHGVRKAYFIDLEFTVLRAQVLELCARLEALDLDFEWCCQTRLDLVDDELLAAMRRAKCTLIHFGVEAADDELLAKTKKGLTLAQVREGMVRAKRAGLRTACFFMTGFPESTEADGPALVALARELEPDYPLFHIAAPYPGTELHERVKSDPALRFSDDSLFPEAVEGRLTLPQLKRLTRDAYIAYYARPGYLLRRLRRGDWRSLFGQARLFWSFVSA